MPPVSCSIDIDFGSDGAKVPMPMRRASEKAIRWIGKRETSPSNSCSSR